MTATQAPTPGPLSGDFNVEEYVADYEFRADEGSYSPTENERALLIDAIHGALSEASLSLAPTAPVEASGSERETALSILQAAVRSFDSGDTTNLNGVLDDILDAFRPQPSGETREPGLSVEMVARFMAAGAAEILSLKNDNVTGAGGWASANWKLFVPQAERLRTAMTTPARSEAQDEGAAGEFETAEAMAEAWSDRVEIQRMVEMTSAVFAKWASPEILSRFRQQMMGVIQQAYIEGVAARIEALREDDAGKPYRWMTVDKHGFETIYAAKNRAEADLDAVNTIPLYAHPSPTPAADADRVRGEIKAWTDTQFPKSCRVGSAKWVNGLTNRILAALKPEGK